MSISMDHGLHHITGTVVFLLVTGALKTQDWKTRDQICRGGKRGTAKHGNIICMGRKT